MRKSNLLRVLAGLMVFVLGGVLLVASQDFLYSLEINSLTLRQRMFSDEASAPSRKTPITLIAFDVKTAGSDDFHRLFGIPMSRSAPGYLVRFLKRTQTKAVVFDMGFNGGTHYVDSPGDRLFVESLRGIGQMASALSFQKSPNQGYTPVNLPSRSQQLLVRNDLRVQGLDQFPVFTKKFYYQSWNPPFPLLTETPMRYYSAQSSVSHADPGSQRADVSGESRRWTPFSTYGNHILPTLALGVALNGQRDLKITPQGTLSWQGGQVNLGSDALPLIKWYGHGVSCRIYPEISAIDVILSELALECQENSALPVCKQIQIPAKPMISPEQFKDRYVLIGMTRAKDGDTHRSIYGFKYSGLYIFANTLDNLLNDDFVHPAPVWLNWAAFFLLPFTLCVVVWRFQSVWMSFLIAVTVGLGYFLLTIHAYNVWNLWLHAVNPILALVACFTSIYVYRYLHEQKQRQQMRYAFGKYVSPAVLQTIEKNPEKITLGGERREMTFLFTDIRGFTSFSDNNPPEVVQAFLSDYFSVMNGIILREYRGTINKLIGDAIMAYWGFPLENEDHAFLAVSAALAMRDALHEWRSDPSRPQIDIGVGINTGDAVIGNVGSEDFMDFTVIGDAVNVASRLESANKEYKTNIIISAATYEKVKGRVKVRSLGMTEVRGKAGQMEIFEPLGLL